MTSKVVFTFANNPQNIQLRKESKALYLALFVRRLACTMPVGEFRKLVISSFQSKFNIGEITAASLFKLHQYLRHCGRSSYQI